MMATELQKHMYVRCPFDREHPRIPRDFITGQIVETDTIANTVTVVFRDPFCFRAYYEKVPSAPIVCQTQLLTHVSTYKGTEVLYNGERYVVISVSREDGWYFYYIQNPLTGHRLQVCESQIEIPFTAGKVSPVEQLKRYEFQNPVWYMGRTVVSKTTKILENSVYGFQELAGCKIYLLPHQLHTIMQCLQEDICRYMLADEVGMGKTIEAAAILKIYLLHNSGKKALVAVPQPLLEQWKTELFFKFDMEAGVDKRKNLLYVAAIEQMRDLCGQSWDFVVLDEAHKLLENPVAYQSCHRASRNAKNILLLSATPVQQKEEQYLQLLRLILPQKYDNISLETFRIQAGKQKKITRSMYNILADLEELIESMEKAAEKSIVFNEDEDCESIYEDILDGLERVRNFIPDEFLDELLKSIDQECTKQGKNKIQEAVIYICENYQLERNILRNRRSLIASDMAKRAVCSIEYQLDADKNTYETAAYEAIVDWITGQQILPGEFVEHYIPLIEAFFSSSWAFFRELLVQKLQGLSVSRDVEYFAKEWEHEENRLLQNMENVLAEPYNYSNRMVSTIDYIDQETISQKIVLFTNYKETLEKYAWVLQSYFGEEQVALFHKQMDSDDLELNIYRFQNEPQCRILLCDETGGEGRNLQIADIVIHIDLPWDANAIEQRIGRLDRLGREADRTVLSVVVHTSGTLEGELYKFWKDGLGVFHKSLSGLEIIMNEINENIIAAVTRDFRYGISETIEQAIQISKKMEQDVREEQLFDTASFLYSSLNQQLKVTLDKYHRNENQLFSHSMLGWATLAGFQGNSTKEGIISFDENSFSVGSAVKSLFIPPLWEAYINKTSTSFIRQVYHLYEKKEQKRQINTRRTLMGTFDRKMAIENDYLHFFAPGDEVFDSIVNNAMRSDKGQCTALFFQSDMEWKGFVFTFSLEPNIQLLLEHHIPVTAIGKFKNYLTMDQIVVPVPFRAYSKTSPESVIGQLEKISGSGIFCQKDHVVHLGRRTPQSDMLHIKEKFRVSNLEWFMGMYPEELWVEHVKNAHKKAVDYAKNKFRKSSGLKGAVREVESMINASAARSRYYGTESEKLEKSKERYLWMIEALRKSQIITESAAFVWMVKANDK